MFHSFFTATSKTSLANRDSRISSDAGELLSMQDIHISHGHKALLRIDKLTVPSQKLVAFIGPNGAGKSTLLHTVLGQHTETALKTDGHITIYGQPINEVMNDGHIAWVGQHERFTLFISH
ncbi:ATP-binding cassette domain-containing protein [Psychrobacter aquimaris]|uniref:ATP-binding cassette domain-containing protein n=1 Tax=Psychrobacter aquimaris TaxID=292733 RepID=UPI001D128809|nr:ATP-binding cassette domain-containing protein [Psychrobacter aquimaris]